MPLDTSSSQFHNPRQGGDGQILAVYDLGGGTFDISILEISGGVAWRSFFEMRRLMRDILGPPPRPAKKGENMVFFRYPTNQQYIWGFFTVLYFNTLFVFVYLFFGLFGGLGCPNIRSPSEAPNFSLEG